MSRTPRSRRPGAGDQPASHVIGDPPPVAPYPLKRGGRAVPDRTRAPEIGPACHDSRKVTPAPAFTEELRRGVNVGSPTENVKARQEHGNDLAEARSRRT
jgi:hypothetical protein